MGAVESVSFRLNEDANFKVENESPFALGGDSGGDYSVVSAMKSPGAFTVSATPFSQTDAAGERGETLTVAFTIVN